MTFWLIWVAVVAGSFGWAEARAVHDPRLGDTLSEVIRHELRLQEKSGRGRAGRIAVLLVLAAAPVWFAVHLLVPGSV